MIKSLPEPIAITVTRAANLFVVACATLVIAPCLAAIAIGLKEYAISSSILFMAQNIFAGFLLTILFIAVGGYFTFGIVWLSQSKYSETARRLLIVSPVGALSVGLLSVAIFAPRIVPSRGLFHAVAVVIRASGVSLSNDSLVALTWIVAIVMISGPLILGLVLVVNQALDSELSKWLVRARATSREFLLKLAIPILAKDYGLVFVVAVALVAQEEGATTFLRTDSGFPFALGVELLEAAEKSTNSSGEVAELLTTATLLAIAACWAARRLIERAQSSS